LIILTVNIGQFCLHVLIICQDYDDVPLFTKETFAAAADHTEEADTEAAVGGSDCADFSLDYQSFSI
jgi:hypothetical protein